MENDACCTYYALHSVRLQGEHKLESSFKILIAVTKKGFGSLTVTLLRLNLKRLQGKGFGLAVSENKTSKLINQKLVLPVDMGPMILAL